jgi:alpha-tubulin suppressor-like RCC1 family protein
LTFEGGDYPGATADGDFSVNAFDGIAEFVDVSIDKPGRYDFTASSPGMADTIRTVASLLRPGPTFVMMSGGTDHSCVTSIGGVFCWGSNGGGQLGAPTGAPLGDSVPVASDIDDLFDWVSAGTGHTCGVTQASAAYCWGQNDDGQLGDATGFDQPSPVPLAGSLSMAYVDAGDRHSCGVTLAGLGYCWGANDQGQLGIGSVGAAKTAPVLVTNTLTFLLVVTGDEHSCGWAADSLAYCWGDNSDGQLGDDDPGNDSPSPVLVAGGHKFATLKSGARHVCGIDADGDVFCWGSNDAGQLGDGGNTDSPVPLYVKTVNSVFMLPNYFGSIDAGAAHTCVLNGPGAGISCFGDDTSGQLGGGATVTGSTLVQTLWITAGGAHTCVYVDDLDGLLEPNAGDGLGEGFRCWGSNASGQLGDGSTTGSSSPVRVIQGW